MDIRTENLTILFVDIAGFTATTSRQSRVQNAKLLETFDKTLVPIIKGFKGKVIKSIGDALLLTFRSPTDAMLCAMALQDAMHDHNIHAADSEGIHIRVAAHLGEVRIANKDIFGEPVNVAARIEGVAPANEIYLSEAVYMAMNKAEVPAKEVGFKELSGIPQPIRLYNIPRFSTSRLIPEANTSEDAEQEQVFPYGGMHYQLPQGGHEYLSVQPQGIGKYAVLALLLVGLGAGAFYLYPKLYTPALSSDTPLSAKPGPDFTQASQSTDIAAPPESIQSSPNQELSQETEQNQDTRPAQDKEIHTENTLEAPEQEKAALTTQATHATHATKVVEQAPVIQPVQTVKPSTVTPSTIKQKQDKVVNTPAPTPKPVAVSTPPKATPKPAPKPAKPRISNVREAKLAYKADKIDKKTYKELVRDMREVYDKEIATLKEAYRNNEISKAEYKRKVAAAKKRYKGSR